MSTSQYVCAITGCEWTYTPPAIGDPNEGFKPGFFEGVADAFKAQTDAIETACREHFDTHTTEEWLREVMTLRAQIAQRPPLLCGACISDARNAEARKQPALPILPASTIASGMAICDVEGRHRIMPQVGGGLVMPGGSIPGMN